jgi:hypothetical protein
MAVALNGPNPAEQQAKQLEQQAKQAIGCRQRRKGAQPSRATSPALQGRTGCTTSGSRPMGIRCNRQGGADLSTKTLPVASLC